MPLTWYINIKAWQPDCWLIWCSCQLTHFINFHFTVANLNILLVERIIPEKTNNSFVLYLIIIIFILLLVLFCIILYLLICIYINTFLFYNLLFYKLHLLKIFQIVKLHILQSCTLHKYTLIFNTHSVYIYTNIIHKYADNVNI